MILPTKYISIRHSLLGISAKIYQVLDKPRTVTDLWSYARDFPEVKTFERFIYSLDFLFIIGAIDIRRGMIVKCQ